MNTLWMWVIFSILIAGLLILDLGVFHRKQTVIGVRESLAMSAFYIAVALLFGGWIGYEGGGQRFSEYLTGFLVEKSLAIDNIFIIAFIFSYFSIPRQYQHRILFWGIVSAIFLRALLIYIGIEIIAQFSWILYLFSGFILLTGIKLLFALNKKTNLGNGLLLKWIKRSAYFTSEVSSPDFFIKKTNPLTERSAILMTPLFGALICIEIMDLVFALDSIPAILTITQDPYLVYTSNIFAILGLRSLFFALSFLLERFHYLKLSLALILVFIGSKIFITHLFPFIPFSPYFSLGITLSLLTLGCVLSIVFPPISRK